VGAGTHDGRDARGAVVEQLDVALLLVGPAGRDQAAAYDLVLGDLLEVDLVGAEPARELVDERRADLGGRRVQARRGEAADRRELIRRLDEWRGSGYDGLLSAGPVSVAYRQRGPIP
jgi:hypothetical protein